MSASACSLTLQHPNPYCSLGIKSEKRHTIHLRLRFGVHGTEPRNGYACGTKMKCYFVGEGQESGIGNNDVAMPDGCGIIPDATPRAADFERLVTKTTIIHKT